jgi:hypothetical protein
MGRKTGPRCYRAALQHGSINELLAKNEKQVSAQDMHGPRFVGFIQEASTLYKSLI